MAIPFVTPNMSLTEPTVGGTLSPSWALILNANFTTLDQHNHAPGSGVPITPAGLNISSDLSFLQNNATNLRTARFSPISLGSLTGADTDCILVSGVDFYVVDGNGNQIRLTQSGGIAGTPGSISGLASPASATYVALTDTFVWQSGSNIAANMDAATYILRYPSTGYPSPSGDYIALQAPSSLASGFAITFPAALPSVNSFLTINSAGQLSTSTAVAPNQVISSSCGNFEAIGGIFVAVTNLSVTITTSGNPVKVELIPDNSNASADIALSTIATGLGAAAFGIFRDGSQINQMGYTAYAPSGQVTATPPGCITAIETPTAGSHTYVLKALASTNAAFVFVNNCKLVVTEII